MIASHYFLALNVVAVLVLDWYVLVYSSAWYMHWLIGRILYFPVVLWYFFIKIIHSSFIFLAQIPNYFYVLLLFQIVLEDGKSDRIIIANDESTFSQHASTEYEVIRSANG